jgi:hypothetical protein
MIQTTLAVFIGLLAIHPGAALAEAAEPGKDLTFSMKERSEHIGNSYNDQITVTWIVKKQGFKRGAAPLSGTLQMVNGGNKPLKADFSSRPMRVGIDFKERGGSQFISMNDFDMDAKWPLPKTFHIVGAKMNESRLKEVPANITLEPGAVFEITIAVKWSNILSDEKSTLGPRTGTKEFLPLKPAIDPEKCFPDRASLDKYSYELIFMFSVEQDYPRGVRTPEIPLSAHVEE